jgi:hypothetical protein
MEPRDQVPGLHLFVHGESGAGRRVAVDAAGVPPNRRRDQYWMPTIRSRQGAMIRS